MTAAANGVFTLLNVEICEDLPEVPPLPIDLATAVVLDESIFACGGLESGSGRICKLKLPYTMEI